MANSHVAGVVIKNATKQYEGFRALDNVSLEVAPGEFVSILGPSGSGKTTFLGVLGGFVPPTSGAVYLGERDITYLPPHKRDIGIVFQSYALFPHMTVAENVAYPLRARRQPKAGWAAKVRDALATVELAGYEHRRIAELSGGQRQRVALARAIVFEPRLILMDEPLSALDKQLRENMQIELRQLHAKLGATVIYVTHDQREALTMSDRVAILNKGKLVQVDTPERLHNRPKDAFVAGFIGEATLLPVERVGNDAVRLGETTLRCAHPVPDHDRLFLAIQAEKLLIDDGADTADAIGATGAADIAGVPNMTQPAKAGAVNRLTGRVTDVVFQGESVRVFLRLDSGAQVSLRQPAHHIGRQRIRPVGEPMTLSLHPEDTIVVPQAA